MQKKYVLSSGTIINNIRKEGQREVKTLMFLCTVPDGRIETALEKAAELGYRSVFCGEEENDRVRSMADAYYITDWSDTEELIRIAKSERIDGVVGLSDPPMLPAARVARALGLPGNTPESLEVLISKDAFRVLQEQAGTFCPKHAVFDAFEKVGESLRAFRYPVIIKPRLCSSSFGQTILENEQGMAEAFRKAAESSRDGQVCIEEYIEPRSLCTVEADVFVVGNDILWEGIRDSWHLESAKTRPLYDVYPAHLTQAETGTFCREVSCVLQAAGICLGEFNVEGFFTKEGDFFVVEINTRQAGYYNPQHIMLSTGVDLTKLLLTTAAGEMWYYRELKSFQRTARHILSYSIFAPEDGILDHVYIAPEMQERLRSYDDLYRLKKGDAVKDYRTAKWPIAQAAFEFDSAEELEEIRERIEDLVYVVLQ